jgi:hypothetical protein
MCRSIRTSREARYRTAPGHIYHPGPRVGEAMRILLRDLRDTRSPHLRLRARRQAWTRPLRAAGSRHGRSTARVVENPSPFHLAQVGQDFGQELSEALPVQEPGESERSGPAADLLVGKPDSGGLFWSLELNELGCCLVTGVARVK